MRGGAPYDPSERAPANSFPLRRNGNVGSTMRIARRVASFCRGSLGCVLLALCGVTWVPATASADLILGWEFSGNAGNESSVNATTQNLGGSPVAVTRGGGLTASTLSNGFSSSGWNVGGTLSSAQTDGDYLQLSFVVPTGSLVSLSAIDANFRRSASGTGPNTFLWQYDIGGGFFDIGSSFTYTGTLDSGEAQPTVDLSGIGALQNLASGTNVSLRLLGAGATNTGATFALGRLPGDDLALSGTVVSVPEPASLALCGIASMTYVAVGWSRRRRARR